MVATYAWISGGELPSQRLRSYTFGLATSIAFLAAWLATFTAPYFINPESLNWGPKYGYIWVGPCWLGSYVLLRVFLSLYPHHHCGGSLCFFFFSISADAVSGSGYISSCLRSKIAPWRRLMRWYVVSGILSAPLPQDSD